MKPFPLPLSTTGKISADDILNFFFIFFPENRFCYIMQVVANGDNLQCVHFLLNPCHAEKIKMPHTLLIVSQSDSLIQIVDIYPHTDWQTVQIQISWLTDLDLHCLQRQGISGLSRTRVESFTPLLFGVWHREFFPCSNSNQVNFSLCG